MLHISKQAALVVLAALAGQAQATIPTAEEPQYGIKQRQPGIGSNIRDYAIEPIPIPINRSYRELTPEERMRWHSYYEDIAPGDEPPFPVEGLKAVLDPLAQAQQKLLVRGPMLLLATVDAAGEVQAVKALSSPSQTMTRVAAEILMLTKFKPALCSGQPCQMDFPLHTHFNVR